MNPLEFVGFLTLGIAITWLLQIAGPLQPLWDWRPILRTLADCDLCLGFWVYSALAILWQGPIFGLWQQWAEVLIVGLFCATLGHFIRTGWQTKFGVTIIK